MSAADEAREHLTAVIWEVLGNYTPAPLVHHADMIHSAAERYGHAIAADTASDMADRILGPVRLKLAADEYSGARTLTALLARLAGPFGEFIFLFLLAITATAIAAVIRAAGWLWDHRPARRRRDIDAELAQILGWEKQQLTPALIVQWGLALIIADLAAITTIIAVAMARGLWVHAPAEPPAEPDAEPSPACPWCHTHACLDRTQCNCQDACGSWLCEAMETSR